MKYNKIMAILPIFLLLSIFIPMINLPCIIASSAETYTITVPSTKPWTDTGITLSPGDTISISASGSVVFADPHTPDNTTGPDGKTGTGGSCTFVVTDPSVKGYSLVGNIAELSTLDGKGFFVGSSFSRTIPIANTTAQSGKLLLGFNDGAVFCDRTGYDSWGFGGDNHGSFTAIITVNHSTQGSARGKITQLDTINSSYTPGEQLGVDFGIENDGEIPVDYRAVINIIYPDGSVAYDTNIEGDDKKVSLSAGSSEITTFFWALPSNAPQGTYEVIASLRDWDDWNKVYDYIWDPGTEVTFEVQGNFPLIHELAINNGATTTTSRTVTLNNSCTNNPTHYMASESSSFSGAAWQSYSTSPGFTLSSGYGNKRVYLKVKNSCGESELYTIDDIQYSEEKIGYVLYMPGIFMWSDRSWTARQRVEGGYGVGEEEDRYFPAEIMELPSLSQYERAYFCYRYNSSVDYYEPEAVYSGSDTRQPLSTSSEALQMQIRKLINDWQTAHQGKNPEIIIICHSLGGAVTALWASEANEEDLSVVKTVFTLDSPIAGLSNPLGSIDYWGDADNDLRNTNITEKMAYGTTRLDFAQVGNTADIVVAHDDSFTSGAWRKLSITNTGDPLNGFHGSVLSDNIVYSFIESVNKDTPPLWSGEVTRPGHWANSEEEMEPLPIKDESGSPITLEKDSNPVNDLNRDGLGEDTNGDGILDFNDVVTLFNAMESSEVQENKAYFDFNGNGRIDFDDLIRLSKLIVED